MDGPQILTLFLKHFNVFKLSNYHLNINNCQCQLSTSLSDIMSYNITPYDVTSYDAKSCNDVSNKRTVQLKEQKI